MPARQLDPTAVAAYQRLQLLAATASTEDEARAVAAELRAFARRVRASRWQPYPWQHPHVHPPGWVSQRMMGRGPDAGRGVCDERCADLPTVVPGVHQWWVQRGGRATGKTDAASRYVNEHMEGPPCDPRVPGGHRMTIAAPTQPDAVASCITGPSGVQAVNPAVTVTTSKEGTIVRWPGGAVGRVLGANSAEDVQRARAWTNVCLWWLEEYAAMRYAGGLAGQPGYETRPLGLLDQAPATLRLGPHPHGVLTTTPTGRPEVGAVLDDPHNLQTWGRTEDAHHVPEVIRISLESKYPPGSSLGRQELGGERVGNVAGALWLQRRDHDTDPEDDRPGIDNDRLLPGAVTWKPHGLLTELPAEAQLLLQRMLADGSLPPIPDPVTSPTMLQRTVLGVDPAGGATENGISVVGEHATHGYTLADLSLKAGPDTWGKRAVVAAYYFGAVGIATERTYGGDQTQHVIDSAAEALGMPAPAPLPAPTQDGKKERAVPVQAIAQVHRLHMVGVFPQLEGELTTWVEDDTESPNRLDAWVHAHRYLLVRAKTGHVAGPAAASGAGLRIPGR